MQNTTPKDKCYSINGNECSIELFNAGWGWTIKTGATFPQYESNDDTYPTHNEALQAAINYVSNQEADAEAAQQQFMSEAFFGTYQQQVAREYRSMTGGEL